MYGGSAPVAMVISNKEGSVGILICCEMVVLFFFRKDYKAMFFKSLKQVRETKEGEDLKKVTLYEVLDE